MSGRTDSSNTAALGAGSAADAVHTQPITVPAMTCWPTRWRRPMVTSVSAASGSNSSGWTVWM